MPSKMTSAHILIVDDEKNITLTLAHALRRASDAFVVDTCLSGQEALALLAKKPFDLVISDQNLGGLSGLELLTQIRQRYPETRTILMTGFGSAQVEREAHQWTDGYLTKPFDPPDMIRLVSEVIRQTHTETPHLLDVNDPLSQLVQRLIELRADVGAPYAILLDINGNTLIDSGTIAVVDPLTLNALLCNSMAAAGAVAQVLQEKRTFDLHYYDGENYEIYCRKVNDFLFLALVVDLRLTQARMGSIWLSLRRAVEDTRDQASTLPAMPIASHPPELLGDAFGEALEQWLDGDLFGEAPPARVEPPTTFPSLVEAPEEASITLDEAIRQGLLRDPLQD